MKESEKREWKAEAYRRWVAEDGLMSLAPESFKSPYPGKTLRTCDNDNGILFLAYFHYLLEEQGMLDESDKEIADNAIQRLRHGDVLGIFDRNPGRAFDPEAHDNYNAITSLSILHGLDHYPIEIVNYGIKHGFTYDNTSPGKLSLKRWRQGTDVSHYKIAFGAIPTPYETLWLALGTLSTVFEKPHVKASNTLLNWLRQKSIDLYARRHHDQMSPDVRELFEYLASVRELWIWSVNRRTDGKGIEVFFENYFQNPSHPCRVLSKGVVY